MTEAIREIENILSRPTGSAAEGRVLEIFRDLTPEEFGLCLNQIDLVRLVQALDDRFWGPSSRKEFLRLLPRALNSLNLESKAILIGALANGVTELAAERGIASLFLSESGEQLRTLKLMVDQVATGHDLLDILYSDIDSADIRLEIISHFRAQEPPKEPALRVISDIDDTIYSSLNDDRFAKGTLYPGVLEFLSKVSPLPPIFLTARPEFISSLFERVTHQQLGRYGIENCTVLSGNIPGLFGHRRMAEQKARTLVAYRELFPEYRYFFVGDSGQGDMALSLSLLSKDEPTIEFALIHKLSEYQPSLKSDHPSVHIFHNYGEAARILHQKGFLLAEEVEDVEKTVTSGGLQSR